MNDNSVRDWLVGFALAALMALTRSGHFSSAMGLPDASLAAFMLAGCCLPAWGFPLLLIEAAGIDLLATTVGGVSGWCITPAYPFLAAAYAVAWWAGRWYGRRHAPAWRGLLPFAAAAVGATLAAFAISNAGFYLFAGYFEAMSAAEYALRVANYLPGYLQGTLLWLGLAVALYVLLALTAAHPARANG
ncbi:MAG: hypothetical protein GX093_11195 [Xanthomonadaceae bacterium]|nr:hypothetical protein [Xanthomonadaceae bacterium]